MIHMEYMIDSPPRVLTNWTTEFQKPPSGSM